MPLNFLLGCSQDSLGNFELARLAEVADLRKELHLILERVIDAMSQAALASRFEARDRNSLKHAIENEESPKEWAARMIRDGQRSEEEQADYLLPMPTPNQFRPSLRQAPRISPQRNAMASATWPQASARNAWSR